MTSMDDTEILIPEVVAEAARLEADEKYGKDRRDEENKPAAEQKKFLTRVPDTPIIQRVIIKCETQFKPKHPDTELGVAHVLIAIQEATLPSNASPGYDYGVYLALGREDTEWKQGTARTSRTGVLIGGSGHSGRNCTDRCASKASKF
ncbi:hypothetical protein BST61_g2786 [Cercospora zeina]